MRPGVVTYPPAGEPPITDPMLCPGVVCDRSCGPRGMAGACRCRPCACSTCVARSEFASRPRPRPITRARGHRAASAAPEPDRLFDVPAEEAPQDAKPMLAFRTGGPRSL
jgi:hypothetical protein